LLLTNKFCYTIYCSQNIYQQGGRTFWVHNTGPFGCLPVNMFYMGTPAPGYLDKSGCVKAQNEMAMEFNRKLKETVINLRKELTQAAITYVDVYTAKYEMMSNPKKLGKRQTGPSQFNLLLSTYSVESFCVLITCFCRICKPLEGMLRLP